MINHLLKMVRRQMALHLNCVIRASTRQPTPRVSVCWDFGHLESPNNLTLANNSTDTSAASFSVNGGLSPTTSGYQSSTGDKTPSPTATNPVPHTVVVSPSASNMSVAAMVSPTSPGNDRRFERPSSYESATQNGASLGDSLNPAAAARRESVDSRINQNFSDMRLGSSPYASNNQSTSSIQNTLHTQRNPRAPIDSLSMHRISNGYQPSADRNPEGKMIRTAPAITGPATSHIARAAEPTKGQAWAFPEEEIQRVSTSHYEDSRRSSIAESVTSSQFTTESRLPPGQRRLDDGVDYPHMSNASSEFPPVHHHTMQHKQLTDLQMDAMGGPSGSQPYSRTPELRVSHKLAERKRRTEMKELFDQLRDLMPQERGTKASKWEILTKGLSSYRFTFARLHLANKVISDRRAPETERAPPCLAVSLQHSFGRERHASQRASSTSNGWRLCSY
jgi:hypothetical protein